IGYSRFYAIVHLSYHEATDVHHNPFTSYARRCHRIDFKGRIAGETETGSALGGADSSQAARCRSGLHWRRPRPPAAKGGRDFPARSRRVQRSLGKYSLVIGEGARAGAPHDAEPEHRPCTPRVGGADPGARVLPPSFGIAPAPVLEHALGRAGSGDARGLEAYLDAI